MRLSRWLLLIAETSLLSWSFTGGTAASAADIVNGAGQADDSPVLVEIFVTARKVEESLQDVPDAVTVLSAAALESAGVRDITDFAARVPNLNFQDGRGFRAGFFNLSMRGIGNSQEGWPSVSYIVDGIPADSTDSIQSGVLDDIERIEVLRGPQSALYGFNSIAGAINVVTKAPTSEWTSQVRASYGTGDDLQFGGAISGPIVPDKLLFRLNGSYRDSDGFFSSASNGLDLDFRRQKQISGRLSFTPTDRLSIDLRGSFAREHNGASYQDKLPDVSFIDDFSGAYEARRAFAGADRRELYKASARVQWDFEPVSLIALAGYSHTDSQMQSSICYDDPNEPVLPANGLAQCVFGPAFGATAPPGAPTDNLFASLDELRSVTTDLRLESRANDSLQWTVGFSTLHRNYRAGFDAGLLLAPEQTFLNLFPAWNEKKDDWWGVYGQLIWKATSRLEFTAAARYDDETYENTSFTSREFSTVVPVLAPDGSVEKMQRQTSTAFQPKGQASFHFTDDLLGYVTVSRGFRAGYFATGNFTVPEHTTNYEVGLKSTLWDGRIIANAAAFHIDYSDQQFSTIIPVFPYRITVTIPETKIDGVELESTIRVSRFVTFGVGLAYLQADVSDGTRSPATPRFNGNVSADFSYPLANGWQARLHIDDRYNGFQYLAKDNRQPVGAKNYLNVRLGMHSERYDIAAFVKNATDERQAILAGADNFAGGYGRFQNDPRSYGIELKASF